MPIASRRTRTPIRAGVLAAALGVALSGCGNGSLMPIPDHSRWGTTDSDKQVRIDQVKMTHEVLFPPGSAALVPAEAERLANFLQRIGAGFQDRFVVDAGPSRGGEAADVLARERSEAVTEFLTRRFLRVDDPMGYSVEAAMSGDTVFVIAGRYVATLPPCPDWRKPGGSEFTNTPGSNYGCATVSNLGMMVADPGDMVAGRSGGPADGAMMIRGVKRYREGELSEALKKAAPTIQLLTPAQ